MRSNSFRIRYPGINGIAASPEEWHPVIPVAEIFAWPSGKNAFPGGFQEIQRMFVLGFNMMWNGCPRKASALRALLNFSQSLGYNGLLARAGYLADSTKFNGSMEVAFA
jgi:hypothetical protein